MGSEQRSWVVRGGFVRWTFPGGFKCQEEYGAEK